MKTNACAGFHPLKTSCWMAQRESCERSNWPQYTVDPQYVEGGEEKEVRSQETEDRRQKVEVRSQKTEGSFPLF